MNMKNILLHKTATLRYNGAMKYAIAFLLGIVCAVWLSPPQPTVELDKLERERIIYEVLERLEDAGYSPMVAREDLIKSRRGWFSW